MNEGARRLTIRDASAPDEPSIAQVIEAAFAELPHSLHNETRFVAPSRVGLSIAMELVDGGSLAFKSSTDTEMVPSPREFGEAFGSIFPIAPS